jgi:hypothetical protein
MYIKYVANIGSIANLKSDLQALLTGTTDINSLSSMCNKDESTIVTTLPCTWTLHDDSAGTNKFCIKNVAYDNPDQYHYVVFTIANTSIAFSIYETWDTATNTGAYGSTTVSLSFSDITTTPSVFYIITYGSNIFIDVSSTVLMYRQLSSFFMLLIVIPPNMLITC